MGSVAETMPTRRARGPFEVTLTPQGSNEPAADVTLGRVVVEKEYHGELEASGAGEMLTAVTSLEGSAGYVAIERVSGTLRGRHGTFVLQHSGTMNRGAPELLISVVPDSGTGELRGLTGVMAIEITGPRHTYDFVYTLPDFP